MSLPICVYNCIIFEIMSGGCSMLYVDELAPLSLNWATFYLQFSNCIVNVTAIWSFLGVVRVRRVFGKSSMVCDNRRFIGCMISEESVSFNSGQTIFYIKLNYVGSYFLSLLIFLILLGEKLLHTHWRMFFPCMWKFSKFLCPHV